MRSIRALLVAIVATLVMSVNSGTALAVMYGQPDNGAHPYVGLAVFFDASGAGWRCSGTLLSPTVFLTAGHCTYGAVSARVWFDDNVTAAVGYPYSGGYEGTAYTHPDFNGSLTLPATHDVGIVVLQKARASATYGALPTLNQIDSISKSGGGANFTVVGYGLQSVVPDYSALKTRYVGTVQLVNLKSALTDGNNIQLTSDPGKGTGSGGTCFGDSGGPTFIGSSTTVAGVNSFVLNEKCVGSGFAHRVDIADSLDFINPFLK